MTGELDPERSIPPEIGETLSLMRLRLPAIAAQVIEAQAPDEFPGRDEFLQNLDGVDQHEPRWHQFGVLTHSDLTVLHYYLEVPSYLEDWGDDQRIGEHLADPIDGQARSELLSIGSLFHDIGKFAARRLANKEGDTSFTFRGHEIASGEILRGIASTMLQTEFDISPDQFEYIARCAELHYELGKLRQAAVDSSAQFTLDFTESDTFRTRAAEIIGANPDSAVEIGVLFLADNLSKVDMHIDVSTQAEIEAQTDTIAAELRRRNLDPRLIGAIKQLPVNVATARKYLEIVTS